MARQSRLSTARCAADQDAAASVIALPLHHCVKIRNAGGNAPPGDFVIQRSGSDRQNRQTRLVDQKRVFIGSVLCPSVLDDTQAAGGNLIVGSVIQQNHAVGNILLQAMPRQSPVSSLSRYDGCEPAILEPPKQPPHFSA